MDIYRWLVEQEQDLLYLVEEAYGRREMIKHPRTAGYHPGDTVKITAEDFEGQIGELKVIDMYQAGDYFGVYLDSVQKMMYFYADEIEKVSK